MKSNRFLFSAVVVVLFFFTSCEKEEEVPPWAGTWASISFWNDVLELDMRVVLNLNRGTYEEIIQVMEESSSEWINYFGAKGLLEVNDNRMNVEIDEIGFSPINLVTAFPTGNIIYYLKGDDLYDKIVSDAGYITSKQLQFAISGNTLKIFIGEYQYHYEKQ